MPGVSEACSPTHAGRCASAAGLAFGARSRPSVRLFPVVALAAAALGGRAYYVATDGTDSGTGVLQAPFATFAKAAGLVGPGDTMVIRGGVYRQNILLPRSGAENAPIVIRNCPGETPILDGEEWMLDADGWDKTCGIAAKVTQYPPDVFVSNLVIEGLVLRNWRDAGIAFNWDPWDPWEPGHDAIVHENGRNITVRYCAVDNTGMTGIAAYFTRDVVIENCVVSRCGWFKSWSSGINIYDCPGANTVNGCASFSNIDISPWQTDGNGIIIDICFAHQQTVVTNNLCFDNGGAGIVLTRSSSVRMINNTCFNNRQHIVNAGEFSYSGAESHVNIVTQNNIGIGPQAIFEYGGDILNDPDCPFFANNLNGPDPLWADRDNRDLRLRPGSPMIDAGRLEGAPSHDIGLDPQVIRHEPDPRYPFWRFRLDIEYIVARGGLRNCYAPRLRSERPDIGAYEYAEATGSPPLSDRAAPGVAFSAHCGARYTVHGRKLCPQRSAAGDGLIIEHRLPLGRAVVMCGAVGR